MCCNAIQINVSLAFAGILSCEMAAKEEHNPDIVSLLQSQGIDDHMASLRYAGIIQKALMPDPAYLKGLVKNYFVLFLPRDIVSGDFYYAFSNRQCICIAAGDCTGHGVPGALLSILGISFLNEIMQSKCEPKANRVLNLMREKVMKALHQSDKGSVAKDSIDLGLCIININTRQLQFAGANRPLLMMRKGELTEFKADKMTIGLAPLVEHPFTNQVIDFKPGDSFYMFSDGFADQFGEMTDKKFKHKHLKRVISSMNELPMTKQKKVLENTFDEWKGSTQQIDDVLVLGFQL
jgi:serine phosphatase RsbU (regulator of sigma subunit)